MESERRASSSSEFGPLLRQHRLAAGLSQEALAERARMSVEGVSALERGFRRSPHLETVGFLATALALNAAEREAFETAARLARTRPRAGSVTVGPWGDAGFSSLPLSLDTFIGRTAELKEIVALLRDHRVVTITGTGGIGKTQTALQTCSTTNDGGVYFVALAPAKEETLEQTIAAAIGAQPAPGRALVETLVLYLKNKPGLLILDNCEHVVVKTSAIVQSLASHVSRLRILATSREPLKVPGERVYRLSALPRQDAIALFADRARAVDHRFALTIENTKVVAGICERLDGIPLAIELAARRVNVLSVEEIAERLGRRFGLLAGGAHASVPRQQTMRAALEWSYDLLTAEERAFFRKLSIFAGSATLAVARVVCTDDATDDMVALDLLSSLVDKSLVHVELAKTGTRYNMLESTREYARDRLMEAGEYSSAGRAHATAFLEVARGLDRSFYTAVDGEWFPSAIAEIENLRAALRWSLHDRGDPLVGQQIVGLLRWLWQAYNSAEGSQWVEEAQAQANGRTPPDVRAGLNLAEAHVTQMLGKFKVSLEAAERAMEQYEQLGDARRRGYAARYAGYALCVLGDRVRGETLLNEALAQARSGDAWHSLSMMMILGFVAIARVNAGDLESGRKLQTEALEIALATGVGSVNIMINLAELEFRSGNLAKALQLAHEVIDGYRRNGGDIRRAAPALVNVAAYSVVQGDYEAARAQARESLDATREGAWGTGVLWALQHFAAVAALRPISEEFVSEERSRAARLLGYVDAGVRRTASWRGYTEQQEHDAITAALRTALGDDTFVRLLGEGGEWSEERAFEHAMLV
jgi:predicted ATPase/transcriptional regulator with XRE-family HTH domain